MLWQSRIGADWVKSATVGDVTVYRRAEPLPVVGRITDIDGPAAVTPLGLANARQRYQVEAAAEPTRLVFRDIYWPGYTATLDGIPLPVTPVADVFVSVTIPAGFSGELVVAYSPAGSGLMIALLAVGGLLVLGAVVLAARRPD